MKIPRVIRAHTWPGILNLLCLLVVTFAATAKQPAAFVGSAQCVQCHEDVYADWQQSDHRKAMEPASKDNVLGDFNDVTARFHGIDTRLFESDGTYQIATAGKDADRLTRQTDAAIKAIDAASKSWPNNLDLSFLQVSYMDKSGQTAGIQRYLRLLHLVASNSPQIKAWIAKYGATGGS